MAAQSSAQYVFFCRPWNGTTWNGWDCRVGARLGRSREIDEEEIRDKTIRQLQKEISLAFKMTRDQKLDLRTRQSWVQIHTNAALVLTRVLKDREEKDWEKRLRQIEEYRKKTTTPTIAASPESDKPDSPQEQNASQS